MNNGNNPQRPPMTPEQRREYEARRRAFYEKKRREEEEKLARKKRYMPYYVIIFAAVLALLIGISAIVVSCELKKDVRKASYIFVIDGKKTDAEQRGELIYINMDSLKDIMKLKKSGSGNTRRFVTESGDYAEFTDGAKTVNVNGQTVNMPGEAHFGDNTYMVPLDTVSSIFTGIEITYKNSRITISLKQITNDKGAKVYEEIRVLAKSADPVSHVISFICDLSEYEAYMNPANRDGYLVLASKTSALGADYVPSNLVTLPSSVASREGLQLNAYAAKALEAMIKEMRADGYNYTYATSAYRDFNYQKNVLFDPRVAKAEATGLSHEEAVALVLRETAAPGTSEHQTGLCVDLVDTRSDKYTALENPFSSALMMEWLDKNAWKFGFILRYPEGKEEITGYSYESWHFRFVGRYHAEKIFSSGLTFDEYLASLK